MSEEVHVGRRQRQRYAEDSVRLVAGCVPYRMRQGGGDSLEEKLEVLMITSPNRHDLVFPKGGWEEDETVEEAACREAFEEAGIRGILRDKAMGPWLSRSKSSESSSSGSSGSEGYCKCYMFAFQVMEEVRSWPEQASHHRRWLSVSEAQGLCRYPWMEQALEECIRLLASDEDEDENGDADAVAAASNSHRCTKAELPPPSFAPARNEARQNTTTVVLGAHAPSMRNAFTPLRGFKQQKEHLTVESR